MFSIVITVFYWNRNNVIFFFFLIIEHIFILGLDITSEVYGITLYTLKAINLW